MKENTNKEGSERHHEKAGGACTGTEYSSTLQCCGNGVGVGALLLQALSRLLYKAGNESTP